MTQDKVVDASAMAAILFQEPSREGVMARLTGARLLAPALLWFELANVAAMKSRRHPEQRERFRAGFLLRARSPVTVMAVEHDAVLVLAHEAGLTAYDASYLWLARHLGAELVTLDKRLAAASVGSR